MKLVEVVRALDDERRRRTGQVVRVREAARQGAGHGAGHARASSSTGCSCPTCSTRSACYEKGVGSIEDIDNGMKLGCGHPMGPFTLLDFVGLDTTYYIANIMFDEFKEPRFAAPPLLKRMVLAGRLGRKSGRGFYTYVTLAMAYGVRWPQRLGAQPLRRSARILSRTLRRRIAQPCKTPSRTSCGSSARTPTAKGC